MRWSSLIKPVPQCGFQPDAGCICSCQTQSASLCHVSLLCFNSLGKRFNQEGKMCQLWCIFSHHPTCWFSSTWWNIRESVLDGRWKNFSPPVVLRIYPYKIPGALAEIVDSHRFAMSTGAGFVPSTVSHCLTWMAIHFDAWKRKKTRMANVPTGRTHEALIPSIAKSLRNGSLKRDFGKGQSLEIWGQIGDTVPCSAIQFRCHDSTKSFWLQLLMLQIGDLGGNRNSTSQYLS